MKLASYIHPKFHKHSFGIVIDNGIIDLGYKAECKFNDIKSVLKANDVSTLNQFMTHPVDFKSEEVTFLPVIDQPNKIICVGMNYQEKRKEFDETTNAPTLFIRFADTLSGHAAPLLKPACSNEFDYEGELAVVIGKHAFNVPQAKALEHVAGYSCFMDGSVRDMQYTWFTSGKNWQHTGGFGPWLVTADEITNPQTLPIFTYLNGNQVQCDNTSNMLRSVPELIEYISRFTPLSPGDVIITGSPGGVGKKRNPPLFMKDGDKIEVEIGGIGRLTNIVKNTIVQTNYAELSVEA